jgi:hypothetical protein
VAAQLPSNAILVPPVSAMPPAVQRYALTGAPTSAYWRDVTTVGNQIPRWGYIGLALVSAWMAYRAYKGTEAREKPATH